MMIKIIFTLSVVWLVNEMCYQVSHTLIMLTTRVCHTCETSNL